MEQRSPDWFAARCGKVTASRIGDVLAKTKSGWGAARKNYAAQLVCERLTGSVGDSFTNAAMQWGIDHEDDARSFYEVLSGHTVTGVGFVDHPNIPMSGASPDGLIGDDGLVEIKCPNTATHLEYLASEEIPDKYLQQINWQLACTGRAWCDFVSYDPRLPPEIQLWQQRVERDRDHLAWMEEQVAEFLKEVDATVADLRSRYNIKEAS